VTWIEAYGCGYDIQLLVSLLDGEDHKDFLQLKAALNFLNIEGRSAARMKL
jgi:hypothetical protein